MVLVSVGPTGTTSTTSTTVPAVALRVLARVSPRVHGVGALVLTVGGLLSLMTVNVGVQVRAVHAGRGLTTLLRSKSRSAASGGAGTAGLSLKRGGRRTGRGLVLPELEVLGLRLRNTLLTNGGTAELLLILGKAAGVEEVGDSVSVSSSSRLLGKRLLGGTGVHAVVIIKAPAHGVTALGCGGAEGSDRGRGRGLVGIIGRHVLLLLRVSIHVLDTERAGLRVVALLELALAEPCSQYAKGLTWCMYWL